MSVTFAGTLHAAAKQEGTDAVSLSPELLQQIQRTLASSQSQLYADLQLPSNVAVSTSTLKVLAVSVSVPRLVSSAVQDNV